MSRVLAKEALRFAELPEVGAWRLLGAYEGFEVVYFRTDDDGRVFDGTSVGMEEGVAWSIHYVIHVGRDWCVRRATATDRAGSRVVVHTDGAGSWTINGVPRADLEGCLDLDFEASVVTNTLPVHRLQLSVGARGESAAAYVRINQLAVERLDQTYRRLPNESGKLAFDYESPRFGYHDKLLFGLDG